MNINKKLLFKIVVIFLLGGTYIFLGLLVSDNLRKNICKNEDKNKNTNKLENIIELFINGGLIMLCIFFIRITITYVFGKLFNGIYGFNIKDISEVNGSVVLSISFLYFMGDCIKNKIRKIF